MLKHKYSLAFALITFAFVVSRNSTAQVGTDWTAMKDVPVPVKFLCQETGVSPSLC